MHGVLQPWTIPSGTDHGTEPGRHETRLHKNQTLPVMDTCCIRLHADNTPRRCPPSSWSCGYSVLGHPFRSTDSPTASRPCLHPGHGPTRGAAGCRASRSCCAGTREVTRTMTSGDGIFRIIDVVPGEYQLTITREGYTSQTQRGLRVSASELVSVDLKMSGSAARPARRRRRSRSIPVRRRRTAPSSVRGPIRKRMRCRSRRVRRCSCRCRTGGT